VRPGRPHRDEYDYYFYYRPGRRYRYEVYFLYDRRRRRNRDEEDDYDEERPSRRHRDDDDEEDDDLGRSKGRGRGKKSSPPPMLFALIGGGAVLLLVGVGLLLYFLGVFSGGADNGVAGGPVTKDTVFQYLPDNTAIFIYAQPAHLKKAPGYADSEKVLKDTALANLPPEIQPKVEQLLTWFDDINSVTVGMEMNVNVPGNQPKIHFVVRTKKEIPVSEIQTFFKGDGKFTGPPVNFVEENVGEKTIYKVQETIGRFNNRGVERRKKDVFGFCQVHPNTIVIGTLPSLRNALERTNDPQVDPSLKEEVEGLDFASNSMVVWVSMAPFSQMQPGGGGGFGGPNNGGAAGLQALIPKSNLVRATISSDGVTIKAHATYKDAEAANAGKTMSEQMSKIMIPARIDGVPDTLLDRVRNSKLQVEGTRVLSNVTITADEVKQGFSWVLNQIQNGLPGQGPGGPVGGPGKGDPGKGDPGKGGPVTNPPPRPKVIALTKFGNRSITLNPYEKRYYSLTRNDTTKVYLGFKFPPKSRIFLDVKDAKGRYLIHNSMSRSEGGGEFKTKPGEKYKILLESFGNTPATGLFEYREAKKEVAVGPGPGTNPGTDPETPTEPAGKVPGGEAPKNVPVANIDYLPNDPMAVVRANGKALKELGVIKLAMERLPKADDPKLKGVAELLKSLEFLQIGLDTSKTQNGGPGGLLLLRTSRQFTAQQLLQILQLKAPASERVGKFTLYTLEEKEDSCICLASPKTIVTGPKTSVRKIILRAGPAKLNGRLKKEVEEVKLQSPDLFAAVDERALKLLGLPAGGKFNPGVGVVPPGGPTPPVPGKLPAGMTGPSEGPGTKGPNKGPGVEIPGKGSGKGGPSDTPGNLNPDKLPGASQGAAVLPLLNPNRMLSAFVGAGALNLKKGTELVVNGSDFDTNVHFISYQQIVIPPRKGGGARPSISPPQTQPPRTGGGKFGGIGGETPGGNGGKGAGGGFGGSGLGGLLGNLGVKDPLPRFVVVTGKLAGANFEAKVTVQLADQKTATILRSSAALAVPLLSQQIPEAIRTVLSKIQFTSEDSDLVASLTIPTNVVAGTLANLTNGGVQVPGGTGGPTPGPGTESEPIKLELNAQPGKLANSSVFQLQPGKVIVSVKVMNQLPRGVRPVAVIELWNEKKERWGRGTLVRTRTTQFYGIVQKAGDYQIAVKSGTRVPLAVAVMIKPVVSKK
ncbi:MAG: hypothetical protein ACFCD0_17820, partial [Gemmataceae bacterium]